MCLNTAMTLMLLWLLQGFFGVCVSDRVALIIDTDVGTFLDDCVAICYALSRQDVFDIKLILTSSFNTANRGLLVAKMLDKMDNSQIDIGIGIPSPSPNKYKEQGDVGPEYVWVGNYTFADYPGPGKIYRDGISRAIDIISSSTKENPVYWVGLAPFANIAQIISINPQFKKKIRFITMAGSIYSGYDASSGIVAEYNIELNITAAQIVFNHTNEISFNNDICCAPLDTSLYFQIYGNNYQMLLNSDTLISQILIENYIVWYDNGGKNETDYRPCSPANATPTLFDLQAMWQASELAMNKNKNCKDLMFIQFEGLSVVVNDSGFTVIQNEDDKNIVPLVYEAISWNDGYNNGSYQLGEYVVKYIIADDACYPCAGMSFCF